MARSGKSAFVEWHQTSKAKWVAAAAVFAVAFSVFSASAYRTISWWNNPELAVAANDLGVTSPPGAVIPTILGWLVLSLTPGVDSAFSLNIFAASLAALIGSLMLLVGYGITHRVAPELPGGMGLVPFWIAGAGAALACLFGRPLWEYAIQYTEYIVTPVFTTLIAGAMIRFWLADNDPDSRRRLFLAALLIGLDLSVHRTNFLLLPALPVWVALRNPRMFRSGAAWLAGMAGLVIGLSFHVVVMAMAANDPFLNIADPSTFDRFLSYVRVDMRGGGFLINLYPRNADFWSVQAADWGRAFMETFAPTWHSFGLFCAPLLFGLIGIGAVLKRSFRFGIALLVLFLAASLGAIVYFNIPENYFRSLHRHYLPSLVLFGIFSVVGAMAVIGWVRRFRRPAGAILGVVVALWALAVPLYQALSNGTSLDGSRSFYARDYAWNLLAGLPPDAILLTRGDNDTFTTWYLQAVEGVRQDVTVLNIPLLNTGWFVKQLMRRDPNLPLRMKTEEIDGMAVIPWADSVVRVGVSASASLELDPETPRPDAVEFMIQPSVGGAYLLAQDQIILRLLQENQFKRPVYVVGVGEGTLPWLGRYVRTEGLVHRVMPLEQPSIDPKLLEDNLLRRYVYRGFDASSISPDPASVWYGSQLIQLHLLLASAYLQSEDTTSARNVCLHMNDNLAPTWGVYDDQLREAARSVCEGVGAPFGRR